MDISSMPTPEESYEDEDGSYMSRVLKSLDFLDVDSGVVTRASEKTMSLKYRLRYFRNLDLVFRFSKYASPSFY